MIDIEFIFGVCGVSIFVMFAVGAIVINIFDKRRKKKMEVRYVNDYQTIAHTFADYNIGWIPYCSTNNSVERADYLYPALGLAEEAGEVAGKYAKAIRDCNGKIDEERRKAILKELGDVCWFVAELATLLGADLSDVMTDNLEKLKSRKERGKIHGSGDNR